MPDIIKELFDEAIISFEEHLNIPFNERIIFSGPYGIGKTTFLKFFFKEMKFKEKYNVIHLFPVNYSILSNEDIFKYLKYDILYELMMTHKFQFQTNHFQFLESAPISVINNLDKILSSFLLIIPQLGQQLFQFYQELEKLYKSVNEVKKKAEGGELGIVENFLIPFHQIEGGLYENNIITNLIIEALEELSVDSSTEEPAKENILIIDDCDRIDPNHIFRIFNAFAAHFDHRNEGELKNKFGFDKVILVCDVDNIRGIFKNNYGASVDFNGYIDKFYSRAIYEYKYPKNLPKIVEKLVKSIDFSGYVTAAKENYQNSLNSLVFVFQELIKNEIVNLRVLLRLRNTQFRPPVKSLYIDEYTSIENWRISSLLLIDLLMEHFGNYNSLLEKIEICEEKFEMPNEPRNYSVLLGDLVLIIDCQNHRFISSEPVDLSVSIGNFLVHYKVVNTYRDDTYWAKVISVFDLAGKEIPIKDLNYFSLFSTSLKLLRKLKYF